MTLSPTAWTPIATKERNGNKWDYSDEWEQRTIEHERDVLGTILTMQTKMPNGTWVLMAKRTKPPPAEPRSAAGLRRPIVRMLQSR